MIAATALILAVAARPVHPIAGPGHAPDWRRVTAFLDSVVADGDAPGAVLGVSWQGRRFVYGAGHLGIGFDQRPDGESVYDLASLTKVIGLTTVVMLAVDEGRLSLDEPIQHWVPQFRGAGKDSVTLRLLLTHASGLPAWKPLYQLAPDRPDALVLADTTPLDTLPGTRFVYSDLGAIVATQAVEAAYGARIDRIVADHVVAPLGLHSTTYLPPSDWRPRIAPTENDSWRGHLLCGEVDDENAARLDGVSGHAGLFSDADDLMTFGEWLLLGVDGPATSDATAVSLGTTTFGLAPPSSLAAFVRRQGIPAGSSRALGWDTPSDGSSAGTRLSPQSFGHTGFTGTSLWIDPTRRLVIVLLSNRINPSRDNNRWSSVRGPLTDLIVEAIEEPGQ
ncbi:MAG: serine hydrolase domain-containing protein [Gemmatimonadales bacterium]